MRARDRSSGVISQYGTLNLTGKIDPGVRRDAHLSLNAFRLKGDSSDNNLSVLPLPGVGALLAVTPAVILQASAIAGSGRGDIR